MANHAQLDSTIRYLRFPLNEDHRMPVQDGSSCPHCEGTRVRKWGTFRGRQRYRCRDCRRTFSTFTGTPLYYLKRPQLWPGFLWCVDGQLSVRSSGLVLGVDKDTALRWRHRLLDGWRQERRAKLKGRLVIGDFCLPQADKGGRYLMRPPRHRAEPWTFPSLQTGPVTVLVAWERPEAMIIEKVGVRRIRASDYDERIAPRVRDVTEIVGSRGPKCPLAGFARGIGASYRQERRSCYPRRIFRVSQQLRLWLRPFRGVSTRRLDNYLEWFRRRGDHHGQHQHFPPTEPYRPPFRALTRPARALYRPKRGSHRPDPPCLPPPPPAIIVTWSRQAAGSEPPCTVAAASSPRMNPGEHDSLPEMFGAI